MTKSTIRVAIDVGSKSHWVGVGLSEGQVLERFSIAHNQKGFEHFFRRVELHRQRLERPCAHLYGSGGMRRLHVRGHENVLKRLLIQVSAFNLGMLMRQSLGVGTPRGLQGRICALMLLILSLFKRLKGLFGLIPAAWPEKPNSATPSLLPPVGTT